VSKATSAHEDQMRDLQRHACLARDLDHLAHRQDIVRHVAVEEQRAGRVGAQMRGQHTARRTGDPRHRGQFGGLRDHAGKVAEPGREPDCAVGHRTLQHRLHLGELLRRRLARIRAHHGEPDTAVAGQLRDVHRESLPAQMRPQSRDVVPAPVELPLRQHLPRLIQHPRALGTNRRDREAAVAADEGRHALAQEWCEDRAVLGNRDDPVRMRVQIDEAGRHDEPGGVDLASGGGVRALAGCGDRESRCRTA
jgi:hypothetical protein